MPTYDYLCDACDHRFELFQSIAAQPERKCPECGRPKLRRLIGAGAAIIFKGSGFYQTDYRSESYKKKAGSESTTGSNGHTASSDGQAKAKATGDKPAKPKRSGSANKD